MGERGPKPKNKVKIEWSPDFAYALGLLATDGSLSNDGRHLNFTSQDKEQLLNFTKCLGIKVKIGNKISGYTGKQSTHIQFGDVNFYKFLLSIGFMPAKTKIISKIKIPKKYFFDFLRGHFDGDGTFILIGIRVGNQALCFIRFLYQPADLILNGLIIKLVNL